MANLRLPAEWEIQSGVMIAWPHQNTDWLPVLGQAEAVFTEIIKAVSSNEKVLLIVPEISTVKSKLRTAKANLKNILFYKVETNDTWTRDFGPITVLYNGRPLLLDFTFNAWGLKFAADLDNQVNSSLEESAAFRDFPMETLNFVLEGGSIESDGQGTILTTSECLLSPNRNQQYSIEKIEKKLKKYLGAKRILWLNYGFLAGDDTDSHVDTLARLCPDDTITYVSCSDRRDEHFSELKKMALELSNFRTINGLPYRLLPLPMPKAIYDESANRLPATYANYLVINRAVLMPVYEDPANDSAAKAVLAKAYPNREIIPIDCRTLILQHGSLHCVTMQLPAGVLR